MKARASRSVSLLVQSRRYDWSQLVVVLVGDKQKIEDQLVAEGFSKPVEVSATGR